MASPSPEVSEPLPAPELGVDVDDIEPFGLVILVVAAAALLALVANRVSRLARIPAPALFLVGAAVASDIWPQLSDLTYRLDERIVTVALIVILFDGGTGIGWHRLRSAAVPVLWIGVVGTVVTAAGVAFAAHGLFGFSWQTSLLLGTALAPTDPAVVFSVLNGREIAGRSGTILEGESGANDPVGIALLISIAAATGTGASGVAHGVGEFGLQMAVGLAVGCAGGLGLRWVVTHIELPDEALYPLRTVAGAAAVYGLASVAAGSGFLAVFVAGLVVGDARAPYQAEVERFTSALSSLGEIVAFTVLGLTIPLGALLTSRDLPIALALAGLLILVVRPLLVGALLLPIRLGRPEKVFVLWAGLKGAVPILLGIFLLDAGVRDAAQIYRVIFVVVVVSVVVQGGSVPTVARLLGIPMEEQAPHPYAVGLRLRHPPDGLQRFTVAPGSPADGAEVIALSMGPDARLTLASRDGSLLPLRGRTRLRAGDRVLVDASPGTDLTGTFEPG